jgi:ABC-type bacteriocin/lantibiotic exporter with double-glycine peptidase domain
VAASLVTVLDRLGIPATQHEMARLALLRPGGGGSAVMAVRGLMLKAGDRYRVRLRRLDYDGLATIPLPAEATVLWEKVVHHSVALLEWKPEGVVLGDPVRGLRTLTRQEFLGEWLGMVVTLEPRSEAAPGKRK